MATRTSSQAGNTHSAPFAFGTAVNDGDDLVVNHAVTIDADLIIAGAAVNAALDVAAGKRMTTTANVVQANAPVTLAANAGIVLDATAADVVWQQGTAWSQADCKIVINGSSGSRCSVTRTGANNAYFDSTNLVGNTGGWDAQYCDFVGIRNGDASFGFRLNSFGLPLNRWRHCTFDACAPILSQFDFGDGSDPFELTDCRWTNSVGTQCVFLKVNNATPGATTFEVSRNDFDLPATFSKGAGLTVEHNVFRKGFTISSGTPASFRWNFVVGESWGSSFGGFSINFSHADNFFLIRTDRGNPHVVSLTAGGLTIDGNWAEATGAKGADDGGDFYLFSTGDADNSQVLAITRCGTLPCHADGNSVSLATVNRAADVRASHNTLCVKGCGALPLNDYTCVAGNYSVYKSNLAWTSSAGDGSHAFDANVGAQDVLTPAGVKNNYGFNLLAGSEGRGFNCDMSVSPDASNLYDTVTGPGFVNAAFNFGAWAVAKGSGATAYEDKVDDGLDVLGAAPTLIETDFFPALRAAFAPTNAALHGTAHDGGDIGAVAYVTADTTPPTVSGWAVDALGTTVSGTVSESVTDDPFAAGSYVVVKANGVTKDVFSGGIIGGTTLSVLLSGTIYAGQTVTVSIVAGSFQDGAGNGNATITNAAVTNSSAVAAPATPGGADAKRTGPLGHLRHLSHLGHLTGGG